MPIVSMSIVVAVVAIAASLWFAIDVDGTLSQAGVIGTVLGTLTGLALVGFSMFTLKKAMNSDKPTVFMGHITGGFALKLLTVVALGAVIYIANGGLDAMKGG